MGDLARGRAEQIARRAYRGARKLGKRALSHALLAALRVRNIVGRRSVVGDAPVVVSLTTYGQRASSVWAAVESIGAGSVRPQRLVLWLDDARIHAALPPSLRRLEKRGLEVRLTENLGPHTKYYPTLALTADQPVSLVTADDDILYPRTWLAELLDAARRHPGEVVCHRAFVVRVDADHLAPYASWPNCRSDRPSPTHFATGVSGVLYPPLMQAELRERGTAFMASTPKADDVWLHWVALRAGVGVRQVRSTPRHFPFIPGTQAGGLVNANVGEAMNDRWISQVYDATDARALAEAGAPTA